MGKNSKIDLLKHHIAETEAALDFVTGIVDTVKVPLMVLNDKLVVLSANQAFFQTFGGSSAQILGEEFFSIYGGIFSEHQLKEKLHIAMRENIDATLELHLELPQGHKKIVLVNVCTVDWKRNVLMILLTFVDDTEHSHLLTEAHDARDKAENANSTKDRFLAMLSHELKTPLLAISLQAEMLQNSDYSANKTKAASEFIVKAAKSQELIINDLLNVSAILAGKLSLNLEPIRLASVIRESLETVRGAAEVKKIELEEDIETSSIWVWGDAIRLQQIFWNLLTNAIKFTDLQGKITTQLRREGNQAITKITDTGKGIPAAFIPEIFDPFTQVKNGNTKNQGGLGLGLAIVRDLVQLHQGTVSVESFGENQGSTFSVVLPLLINP